MAVDLIRKGFNNVSALKGGWDAWLEASGQVERKNH
jgi:rhodanese-related sulfurtransferase